MKIRRVGAESFHEARSKNLMLRKYVESIQYLSKNDDDDDKDNNNNNNLYHIHNASNKKFSQLSLNLESKRVQLSKP